LNTLPDFTEAYFGTILLYLMDGRFSEILTLYPILYEFEEYRHFMILLRSHIYFHQGDFNSALAILQELPKELVFPENRVYLFLFQVYRQILELSPDDFEAAFKLGLLLHITGRFDDAEKLYLRAGQYKGLVPYISETLAFKAIRERRILPAREAAKRMFELAEIDKKDKWVELAKNLDKFVREYRFLAQ
jgi:tetratricopeptide (TPR) repeat protein